MEGIAKAKAQGLYKGRKPSVPMDEVRRLHSEGVRPTDIAKQLKIGRGSVYRALDGLPSAVVTDKEIDALLA